MLRVRDRGMGKEETGLKREPRKGLRLQQRWKGGKRIIWTRFPGQGRLRAKG